MAIRAKELAQMLGVSTATMSLVLNNKPGICEHTRQELVRKIMDMGYGYMLADPPVPLGKKPLAYVIYSRCGESEKIMTVEPGVIEGAETAAREWGYDLVIRYINPCCGESVNQCIPPERYEGCIIQKPCLHEEEYQELEALGIPYIMIEGRGADCNSVSTNSEQAMRIACEYLQQHDHRNIQYVKADTDPLAYQNRRRCFEGSVLSLKEWADCAPGTAVIAENDEIAAAVIRLLTEKGLQVPEDVSVLGFGDSEICAAMNPELTSVRTPDFRMGWEAVQILMSSLKIRELGYSEERVHMEINAELVIRGSVQAAKR